MEIARVVVYRDQQSEWRWRSVANNNEIIGESSESYKNRQDCVDAALAGLPAGADLIMQGDEESDGEDTSR